MAKKFTDEQRNKLIEQVGLYYIKTKASYREIASIFGISLPTVKDYIERYKKMHSQYKEEIENSINSKTSQNESINNPEVRERVIQVYMYVLNGYTIEEIADLTSEKVSTIYNDINIRLEQISPAYKNEVATILTARRNQNLVQNQRKKEQ